MRKPGGKFEQKFVLVDDETNSKADDIMVSALSLFFDDIRVEAGGKLTMIGLYHQGNCLLVDNSVFDRVAVYTHAAWAAPGAPATVAVRLDLPGREPATYPLQVNRVSDQQGAAGRFVVQSVIHLRFGALRPGDTIRAWLTLDGADIPAGELQIRRAARPVAPASAAAPSPSSARH